MGKSTWFSSGEPWLKTGACWRHFCLFTHSLYPRLLARRRKGEIQGACRAHLRRQEGRGDSRAARLCPPERSPGRAEATAPTSGNALPRFFFSN